MSEWGLALAVHRRRSHLLSVFQAQEAHLLDPQHSWKEISTTLFMYNAIPGISEILRAVLSLRYRLAPTFYSLYVTEYHRNGWPLLKVTFYTPHRKRSITRRCRRTAPPLAPLGRPVHAQARRGVPFRISRPSGPCYEQRCHYSRGYKLQCPAHPSICADRAAPQSTFPRSRTTARRTSSGASSTPERGTKAKELSASLVGSVLRPNSRPTR